MVAPALAWAYWDHHVWPWDQAQYGEVTLRILGAFQQDWIAGIEAMGTLLDFKAPGLPWLGLPYAMAGRFLDRPELALLGATLTWQLGTLVTCWWSAFLVSRSRLTALGVTAFIGSMPLFVGLNHQYLVEPLQTFAVSLSFLLALRAKDMSSEATLIALCLVAALAMAAKASSPIYCGLPWLYTACVLAKRGSFTPMTGKTIVRVPLLLLTLIALGGVTAWYATHFNATFHNIKESTVGSFAPNYGVKADLPTKLGYWASAFAAAAVSRNPFLLLAGIAGLSLGLLSQRRTVPAEPRAPDAKWIVLAAATHVLAAWVLYAGQVNDDTRFLEPLLPATAIVLAWLCSRRWRVPVATAVLAVALADLSLNYSYALGLSAPAGVGQQWLTSVQRDDSMRRDLVTTIALTCDPDKPYAVNVVGVDYAELSHFSANFYAAMSQEGRPACQYTALGYALTDPAAAGQALDEAPHRYFVSMRPEKMPSWPAFLNRVSEPLFDKVASSKDWEQVRNVGDTIVIFRSKRYDGMAVIRKGGK